MEPMPTRFRLQAVVERLPSGNLRESSKGSPIPLGLDLMFRFAAILPRCWSFAVQDLLSSLCSLPLMRAAETRGLALGCRMRTVATQHLHRISKKRKKGAHHGNQSQEWSIRQHRRQVGRRSWQQPASQGQVIAAE